MKTYYCIGNDIFYEFLKRQNFAHLIRFNFNPYIYPITNKDSNGVIIQAEDIYANYIFHNIKLTLPLLITSNFKKPIYLVGMLSKKYYTSRFQIVFNSTNVESEVYYTQIKNNTQIHLYEDNIIHKKFDKNNLWKPYFKKVNFIDKMDHDLKKEKSNYEIFDLNKYKKIIKNLRLWII